MSVPAGRWKKLGTSYDEALARLPQALAAEGFGIVSQIDLAETLRTKLGEDIGRYRILGACNPKFARDAIAKEPQIGVLLPCNVVLYELAGSADVMLGIIDPMQAVGAVPALASLATDVASRLERVLASMP